MVMVMVMVRVRVRVRVGVGVGVRVRANLRQALNPSSHVCLSASATETHCFSHAPPLLQQLGTSGALLG